MSEAIEQRAGRWCQAISADSFCGELSRYEPDYEKLLAETNKLGSVQHGSCDWKAIFQCADRLLCEKSKDMNLLGPLCAAAFEQEGFAGLAAGLTAYRRLFEEHGQSMYPRAARKRGRAGAYEWLTERLLKVLEARETTPAEHDAVAHCAREFEQLDASIREDLADLHPRVGRVKDLLAGYAEQTAPASEPAPAPAPEPAAEPAAETQSDTPTEGEPPTAAPEPAVAEAAVEAPPPAPAWPPASIDDDEQAAATLERAIQGIARLAAYHLRRDSQRAIGYQLAHISSTLGVVPDGDRSLQGPSPRQMRELQQAVAAQRSNDALAILPGLLEEGGGLSLDAACQLGQALEQLGEAFEPARTTLVGAAMELCLRMGDLVQTNAETLAWLQAHDPFAAMAPAQVVETTGPESGEPHDGAPVPSRVETLVADAEREAERRGLEAGCRVLREGLKGVGSKPERFTLRLALARLCAERRAPEVARPILKQLLTELRDPIGDWEPHRVAEVAQTLLTCDGELKKGLKGDAAARLEQEMRETMDLLAGVDPEAACQLAREA